MMNRAETAQVMGLLHTALRVQRPATDYAMLLDAWAAALEDIEPADALAAATIILREDQYFPEPSRLRTLVLQATLGLPDADQAWARIQSRKRQDPGAFVGLTGSAVDALSEAVKALGGWYCLRHSERPERDRDTFYRLWPDIRARYLRYPHTGGIPLLEGQPGEGAVEVYAEANGQYLREVRVPAPEPEDPGIGLVDYANQEPKPVPAAIQQAPKEARQR